MELITGHAGEEHISSGDVASMLRGMFGSVDCVVDEGDLLSCTALNANTIEIGTGGCLVQGHYCRVELAEQLALRSGSPGFKRNDLVVVRYELSTENTQSCVLAIVEGTPTTATPEDPAIAEGVIDAGDQKAEFALWRIPIDGVNVGTPERVTPTWDAYQTSITDLRESVSQLLLSKLVTSSVTIAGSSTGMVRVNCEPPDGYQVAAITAVNTGTTAYVVTGWYTDPIGDGKHVQVGFRNMTTSSVTGSISVKVLMSRV